MPGERLPRRKLRDVLRLRAEGMSKRKIAASLSIGATAAADTVRRARRAGLSWPLPEELSDEALERLLYPPPRVAAADRRPQPDWPAIHRELRRPGVTLQLLWEEHRGAHPDGYGYSRYVAAKFMLRERLCVGGSRRPRWSLTQHNPVPGVADLCPIEVRHGSDDLSQSFGRPPPRGTIRGRARPFVGSHFGGVCVTFRAHLFRVGASVLARARYLRGHTWRA
jgi:hypothetical protein